ncbi:hypothetical protein DPMN_055368 [Dreissena polymorpha]|uniref:Uncharacterized protein n=1 Tax=Dreissena polymorpha TaxID=45954 RepID=A0A9D4HS77_DREPO|nr:hypothetical protein DPMN_055368 [Dreissena polymorpha]
MISQTPKHTFPGASLSATQHLCLYDLFLYTSLLKLSGDIELNPGPDPNMQQTSYSVFTNHGLSIMHLNIQSLVP